MSSVVTSKINHIRKLLPEEEHYRHKNFVLAIVSKEIWEQAQFLLNDKPKQNVRASSGNPSYRYTGLIKCGDCGSSFVCKTASGRNIPPESSTPATAIIGTARSISHRTVLMKRLSMS